MRTVFIGILLFCTQLYAQLEPTRFDQMTTEQISEFVRELYKNQPDRIKRLIKVSQMFLDVEFKMSPLGEGPGQIPDEDPMIRFDAVDCTTFVEQSMALALADGYQQALELLRMIRYQNGVVKYQNRNHFTMAQWIPNNIRAGFVVDITEKVGSDSVKWIRKRFDAKLWNLRKDKNKWPLLEDDQIPQGTFRLPVIPIERIKQHIRQIPSGTLVNIVRHDFNSIPARVSHQGIIIVRGGRYYIRHAARAGYGKVVDELFETFISRNLAYKKWPVTGMNFLQLHD
jgi:hypothetical protein